MSADVALKCEQLRFFQMARPTSFSRTPLRFHFALLAAVLWLSAAPALAQDVPDITLKLSPAEVAEIARLIDLAAPSTFVSPPPAAYWDLQITIGRALEADPAALRAVLAARCARQ